MTLLLVSGANRDLGVALVVGSLFGIGAIAGQASYAAWTYEQALRDRALGEFEYEELMRLGAQVQEKRARLRDSEQD